MKPLIAVIDYGMGNLRSVSKALELAGAKAVVTSKNSIIRSADAVVFPGVGAFGPAMKSIRKSGLDKSILEVIAKGKPFLGLCLGFQLLFDTSIEDGNHKGLGIIPGKVIKFKTTLKVPHMGWNTIKYRGKDAKATMFKGIPENSYFYFVHSYYAATNRGQNVSGITSYGIDFCSAVIKGKVWGCQFHPEKSSANGIKLLKNFIKMANKC